VLNKEVTQLTPQLYNYLLQHTPESAALAGENII
jgi:hypothetical protein